MVVGILKAIQEEPVGKYLFSKIKLSDNILSIH